jgi:hypothetical protein
LGGDLFRVHEGALLLLGIDANERLRQFHDQVMVLRGAAFNGMVAFSLCLFWWCRKRQYWLRFAVPFLYLVPGGIALRHHLGDRPIVSPPYMEFTLLVLAAAGMYLTRKLTNIEKESGVHSGRGELWFGYLVLAAFLIVAVFWGWWSGVVLAAVGVYLTWKLMNRSKEPENQEGQGEIHFGYLILAAFLTAAAFLGWWSTEVLYDQQVIYSYAALNKNAANAPSADATK